MLFTSPIFIFFFFPIVFALNLILPGASRNYCVLFASLAFYFYGENILVILLLASIAANYAIGQCLENLAGEMARRLALFLGVAFNLALLGYYKYANFFVIDILGADAAGWTNIALPLGISFYSFQGMSYVIDIYNGKIKSAPDIATFGAYISCFPQLVAGPIVRYEEVAGALAKRRIRIDDVCEGCRRFALGLGKKMLIANPLGQAADKIWAMPPECLDMPHAWLAIIGYALQIYYDFSGYSDMAIGLGRFLGFRFPENFDYPYSADSIREFWRRWHMTLTRWFRDYVYIPLGGNRRGVIRTACNKWTVFALCGLWHGASWNFLAWGLYHGFFIALESMLPKTVENRLPKTIRRSYALLVVALGWVIFRSDTMAGAGAMYKAAFGLANPAWYPYSFSMYLRADLVLVLAVAIVGCFPAIPAIGRRLSHALGPHLAEAIRLACLFCVFIVACSFSFGALFNPFLYFRF